MPHPNGESSIETIATECYQIQQDLVLEDEGFETVPDTDNFLSLDENIMEFGKTGEFLFSVHVDELKMLQERAKVLASEKERRREELAVTGAEIARLWTLLRCSTEERNAFQASFKMNLSMETLKKGRIEVYLYADFSLMMIMICISMYIFVILTSYMLFLSLC